MSLLVSRNGRVSMNIDRSKIYKNDPEKLFSLKFDKKLTFDDHISDICKKAGKKISALARVTRHMTWELRKNAYS